jgi:MFS family permease
VSLVAGEQQREPWRLVVALGITQITSWGSVYYLFALLLQPVQRDLAISKPLAVGAFSLALLISGLLAPRIGAWIDAHGGRRAMVLGSLLMAVGLFLLSHVQAAATLYAVWALLGVAMALTLYDPAFAVVTRAFTLNHRRAITVLTLFGGLASTVFWPLTQALIDEFGWRGAVQILALINLAVCVPLHLTLPSGPRASAPASVAAAPSRNVREVLRDPRFYLLAGAFTANILVFSAMAVHMIAMLEAKGMSAAQAAALGALIGPMQVAGRLAEFALARRLTVQQVGLAAAAFLPLSLLIFATVDLNMALFVIFAMLYGTGNGVMTIVRGAIPVELYGRDHYGAVNGALAAPVLVAKAAGPLLAALMFSAAGHYNGVLALLTAVAALAVVLLWAATRQRAAA